MASSFDGAISALDYLDHGFPVELVPLKAKRRGWEGIRTLLGLSVVVASPSSPMSLLWRSCPLSLRMSSVSQLFSSILKK